MWPEKLQLKNLRVLDVAPPSKEGIGAEYPLFNQFSGERNIMAVCDALLTEKPYKVKAMAVVGCNPMSIFPDTNMTERALKKLDLLLVIDLFMTETAAIADVFLPACYALETAELRDYTDTGIPMTAYAHKAIEAVGQSMPDWIIWSELGKKMGYDKYFPWKNSDELFEYLLEPTDYTLAQVKAVKGGIMTRPEQLRYLKNGFNTPSGKVEIYSAIMEKHGYDPLPSYKEPSESLFGDPELADKYPLILITGPRNMAFTHSQHRNIPRLLKMCPEPFVEIHPDMAQGLNIDDSDMVTIESPRGKIRMKARLTDKIDPRVVSVPHGWQQANANVLTSGDPKSRDPISGFSPFRTALCSVQKG